MAILIPVLGFYLIYPVAFVLLQGFNVSGLIFGEFEWGLDNWRTALEDPRILTSVRNSFLIWGSR